MKRIFTLLLVILFYSSAAAIDTFTKVIHDADAGSRLRIVATADEGWAVFFLDSFKLYKFNHCGVLQWSKKYQVSPTTWNSNDFIKTQSDGFAFTTRILNGSTYASLLTKINADGNVIWSKIIGESYYDHFTYTLNEDSQGNFILFANVAHHNISDYYNMICKISPAGIVLWTKFYDHGGTWGGAIVTSDNGVLARTGSTFIKTDNAGNVQWTSSFYASSTYNYLAPVEVSDGYIYTTYTNSGANHINFHKMDKQGNLLWGGYKRTNAAGVPPVLRKKNNGNFTCTFNSTVAEFDKDLTVIHTGSLNAALGLYGRDICFLNDGTPVLAGIGNGEFFISKMDAQYHTSCDTAPSTLIITTGSVTQFFGSTQVTSFTMNATNTSFLTDSLFFPQSTFCRSPGQLNLGNDTLSCSGSSFDLQNQTNDLFDTYSWSTGETTPTITVIQSGTYHLLVTNSCGEDSLTDSITVTILSSLDIDLGTNFFLCEDSSLVLAGPSCDSCTYEWNTGSMNNKIEVNEEGQYWLQVTTGNGCISSDTVLVTETKCDCSLFLPSAFSPNHDGRNEIFLPVYYCDMLDYHLKIFNRWGQVVYEGEEPSVGWNGTQNKSPVPAGMYPYTLSYTPLLDGRPDETRMMNGTVLVTY